MNIFGSILSSSSPIAAVGNALDQLFTSDEERAQAAFVMEKLRQQPHILQSEINKIEAGHRSIFVAGWRPFIGWVCGVALFWHFIAFDLITWITTIRGYNVDVPSLQGTEQLIPLVVSLIGLGGLRTFEKVKGVSK